ncbi:MAG: TIGR03936 family radical SAM-associated protein [Clostridium sp.]|nr:TIGR03936 family radical SAM-associated protein [Acetatifactor muris]MCM1562327.1 TIGR03936 family radical SAM-associated protein [Clostridium sp.]
MRYFQKALRRAGIDVAYTGGYSPHQIMSFAAPLGIGAESNGEYMDIEVRSLTSPEDVRDRLNRAGVEDIRITDVRVLSENAQNAMASVAAAAYTVRFAQGKAPDTDMKRAVSRLMAADSVLITKEGKKGRREVDIRPGIYACEWRDDALHLLTDASSGGNIKPSQVMEAMLSDIGISLEENALRITREETYADTGAGQTQCLVPLGEMGS